MKTCNFIEEEKLSAYIDGELTDKEMQLVADHIKECETCRNLIEEIEELSDNTNFYYKQIENSIELPNLMRDLNYRLQNLDNITNDNIIEFPKLKKDTSKNKENSILGNIYKFAPAVVSIAAIFLISFVLLTTKSNMTQANTQAKSNEGVTIDSLEYSKFNAMIYKTKKKNKTVIWLFKENNNNEDDGPI
jgi:hypothetical protein